MLAGSGLHLRGIGAALGVDDLAVLDYFSTVHIAGDFRHRLHIAAVPKAVFQVVRA